MFCEFVLLVWMCATYAIYDFEFLVGSSGECQNHKIINNIFINVICLQKIVTNIWKLHKFDHQGPLAEQITKHKTNLHIISMTSYCGDFSNAYPGVW